MTFLQDVPVGAVIFLDCGCRGHCLPAQPDEMITVIVEQPCPSHVRDGQPHIRQLEPLTFVSAFTKAALIR